MSPDEKQACLDALRGGASVREANTLAKCDVYHYRRCDPEFDAACREIIAARHKLLVMPGFVPIGPYREALYSIPPEQRRFARCDLGMTGGRWGSYMRSRQKTISIDEANRIAEYLARPDLYVDEDANMLSTQETATVPNVCEQVREVSDLTAVSELLRRAELAYRTLRFDSSIHPLDALAMVVWPPERFLEDAA